MKRWQGGDPECSHKTHTPDIVFLPTSRRQLSGRSLLRHVSRLATCLQLCLGLGLGYSNSNVRHSVHVHPVTLCGLWRLSVGLAGCTFPPLVCLTEDVEG